MNQNKATKSCTFLQWKHFFMPQPANYRNKQTEIKNRISLKAVRSIHKTEKTVPVQICSVYLMAPFAIQPPTIIITFHSYHIDGDAFIIISIRHAYVCEFMRMFVHTSERQTIQSIFGVHLFSAQILTII